MFKAGSSLEGMSREEILYQDFKTQSNIMHVTINGKRHGSTMLTHNMIKDGAVIEFRMGAEPVNYTL